MIFNSTQPIFIQIADYVSERILRKEFLPDQQTPSVRELAVQLEVNPNTVMRAFERLLDAEVVYNKRGMGYYVTTNAYDKILAQRRATLIDETFPGIFEEMNLLGVSVESFIRGFRDYQSKKKY